MTTGFDPISYLQTAGIQYWTSGKNVTQGWVNIQCPFCDDHSNHLGISLATGLFNCWACPAKGGPEKLIMALEGCSYGRAKQKAHEHSHTVGDGPIYNPLQRKEAGGRNPWPANIVEPLRRPHREYLERRGFSPGHIAHTYGVQCGIIGSKFASALVIPVIMGRTIVSYIKGDITGKDEKKYKLCSDEDALLPGTHLIYNYDNVTGKRAAAVEGTTDVWRVGHNCFGFLRKKVTPEQLAAVGRLNLELLYLVLDSDVPVEEAMELGRLFRQRVPQVEVVFIEPGEDPDTMNGNDLAYLKTLIK